MDWHLEALQEKIEVPWADQNAPTWFKQISQEIRERGYLEQAEAFRKASDRSGVFKSVAGRWKLGTLKAKRH